MTNSKNHAFLMCPTSAACALGGTPPQRGVAGGHIKKANWVHVLDALPLRLKLPCEITRFKLDQFVAGQAAANLCFVDLFATVSSGRAEGAQLGGGECGHLGGLHGVTEDQAVGRDFQALTEELELSDVGLGIAGFPKGDSGLIEARAIGAHAPPKFGLRKAFGAAGSGQTVAEGFFAGLFNGRDVGGGIIGPLAHLQIVEAGEPLVFVAAVAGVNAAVNQDQFAGNAETDAFKGAMLDQLHAHATDTISVGCDAAYWVNGATDLDVSVAEVADVKVFGHLCLLRWFLLALTEPDGPQNLELPYALVWNVFAPLRNRAWSDAEKVGQVFGPLGEVNSLLGLHVSHFSTLKT